MEIVIRKDVAEAIGLKKLAVYGVTEESWRWNKKGTFNIRHLTEKQLTEFTSLFEKNDKLYGVRSIINALTEWKAAIGDTHAAGKARVRNLKHFLALLEEYVRNVPGHRIYERVPDEDAELAYYVNGVDYHTPHRDGGPPFVSLTMIYQEFGVTDSKTWSWTDGQVRGRRVVEILAEEELYGETRQRRLAYFRDMEHYGAIYDKIGKQFYARGVGDELGGGYWHTNKVAFEKDGEPSCVVIDVFSEKDEEGSSSRHRNSIHATNRWDIEHRRELDEDESFEDVKSETEFERDFANETEAPPQPEVPVHPYVAVFHLGKHLRVKVHAKNLEEYVYDKKLIDKLVIDNSLKSLVHMLVEHKSAGFVDIVKGKQGGAVVLLAGPPGVGKTLTAEVFAEAEERALYSVQCSQLGVDPADLEKQLVKVFGRAARWNAVLLLDEADVYVHERGRDLNQNAIVGVFLRVLEYQNNVMFMTTNRPDDVDDAILSRCIARLNYKRPDTKSQKAIWRILADASNIEIEDDAIDAATTNFDDLSGRDIKNLLKLARLVVGPDKPVTFENLKFVRDFQPTFTK